jgi:hypothetical protein
MRATQPSIAAFESDLRALLAAMAPAAAARAAVERACAAAGKRKYRDAEAAIGAVAAAWDQPGLDGDRASALLHLLHADFAARAGRGKEAGEALLRAVNTGLVIANMQQTDEARAAALASLEAMMRAARGSAALARVWRGLRWDEDMIVALGNHATGLMHAHPDLGAALAGLLHDIRRASLGERDGKTLLAAHRLGAALMIAGRAKEAEPILRKTLEIRRRSAGPDHELTLRSAGALAACRYKTGQRAAAIALQEKTYAAALKRHGPDHQQTQIAANNLAEFRAGR